MDQLERRRVGFEGSSHGRFVWSAGSVQSVPLHDIARESAEAVRTEAGGISNHNNRDYCPDASLAGNSVLHVLEHLPGCPQPRYDRKGPETTGTGDVQACIGSGHEFVLDVRLVL